MCRIRSGFMLVLRLLLVLSSSSLMVGCVTYAKRIDQMRHAYDSSDVSAAQAIVAEASKRDKYNSDVLRLDLALVELAAGRPKEAEQELQAVRDRLDALEEPQIGAHAWSYLTDDHRRDYCGEDYEKVLLRAFLALSNLMHDGGDAEAYSLQMVDKQEQIITAGANEKGENPKAGYQRVAFAPYLRGVLREATLVAYDDAERSYVAVCNWQPGFQSAKNDLERVLRGRHSQPGNGVLYVFALTGRGPSKREVVEEPTSASLLIAGEILSAVGKQTVPPNVAPVKVPQLVAQRNAVQSIGVDINARAVAATETVTDITQLALQQYSAIYPQVIARAVARRCVKMGVVYGGKEAVGIDKGSLPGLALDLAGIAWEATESADTRCWGLLPDKIQVLRVELPVGEYQLTLRPLLANGTPMGNATTQWIRIGNGRNTYVLASAPENRVIGQVLVNSP